MRKFPVVEIFGPTIAGEGNIAGEVTHFVRTGLCDWRCSFCDSMHAVLPESVRELATYMSSDEVVERLMGLPYAPWVSLSGGNPVIHDLSEVVTGLRSLGRRVNVETQGSIWRDWLTSCDVVTVSPKPPSSGMNDRIDPKVLDKILALPQAYMKVVAFDDRDLDWVEGLAEQHRSVPLYISTGTRPDDTRETLGERYRQICESVLERGSLRRAAVGLQLHVVAWGHRLGV